MLKTDILIIGSGIAGLFFAIKTARKRPDLSIIIMTKENAENTNTQMAQGGIAAVTNLITDSFDQHINDTLQSGGGYCDENIVKMVIEQAPERLKELVELGTSFDKKQNGEWKLALEGGHSKPRVVHHKDSSGLEIEQKLLRMARTLPNVFILENHFVIDLNTEKTEDKTNCTGAFFFDKTNSDVNYIRTRTIVLSTGGCGQLFANTTNPEIATGDGVAMAARIGVEIQDMQYIQFHPTALFSEKINPLFLISEAVRGFGAHIINQEQKRFLFRYDHRGELATRDIVSQAISKEMEHSKKEYVYLDCRHLDAQELYRHFPAITAHCNEMDLRPEKDLIPIVPAAHYQCGGIKVDQNGATSIKNLYAIGECARTGLHGKNRLASNSLLEALVFAHQASENINNTINQLSFSSKTIHPKFPVAGTKNDYKALKILKKELQSIMTCFYNTDDKNTELAAKKLKIIKNATATLMEGNEITVPFIEFSNMLTTALTIVMQCKKKQEQMI